MTKYEYIIENVSMCDVARFYNIDNPRPRVYRCPFHGKDEHPSATISKDGKWFRCFACGVCLNVIHFVSKIENCSRGKAADKIIATFNLPLSTTITRQQLSEIMLNQEKVMLEKKMEKRKKFREKVVLRKIINAREFWEEIKRLTHLTLREYKFNLWQTGDLYFFATKKVMFLDLLYEKCSGINSSPTYKGIDFEYEDVSKNELIEKLYKDKSFFENLCNFA